MKIKCKLNQYLSDLSGNVAVVAAITLPTVLGVIGFTMTLIEVGDRESRLQNHADNLSLMIAKLVLEETDSAARNGFLEYTSSELQDRENCTFSPEKTREGVVTATVDCTGTVSTAFPKFLNMDSMSYQTSSTSTVLEQVFEVAFVFDISDSMAGAELLELQSALVDLTDSVLFEHNDSRLSLIPFANTVRLDDRFKQFVNTSTGYDDTSGVYTGCFDRDATDPNVDIKSTSGFSLVNHAIRSGRVVCPNEDMTAIFHRRSTDWEVRDISGNISLAFGTGMSDGLVWGYRSLDPELRGVMSNESQYPLDSHANSSKHLIMMTDGRPYDRPYVGPGGGDVTRALSFDRFEKVCSELEFDNKGISFHLINFNNNKLTDEAIEIYQNCVTGNGRFYDVEQGELSEVLGQIANQASSLRISN